MGKASKTAKAVSSSAMIRSSVTRKIEGHVPRCLLRLHGKREIAASSRNLDFRDVTSCDQSVFWRAKDLIFINRKRFFMIVFPFTATDAEKSNISLT